MEAADAVSIDRCAVVDIDIVKVTFGVERVEGDCWNSAVAGQVPSAVVVVPVARVVVEVSFVCKSNAAIDAWVRRWGRRRVAAGVGSMEAILRDGAIGWLLQLSHLVI
eukprot:SAG31_NODE_6147_length_2149_cov_1.252683_1_plen_107_part_10